MANNRDRNRKPSWLYLAQLLLSGLAVVVCLLLVFYRPDRPDARIVPASSSGPAFAVQIVRPRVGLPLGGLLPPQLFGLDAHLGFNSTSKGAKVRRVGPRRIEMVSDDWELLLVVDDQGRVTSETQVVFDLVFEDRRRTVRCRPADPVVGTLEKVVLEESGELAGNFRIELVRCEDAETGKPLGWPPKPLVLHGSFDRLRLAR